MHEWMNEKVQKYNTIQYNTKQIHSQTAYPLKIQYNTKQYKGMLAWLIDRLIEWVNECMNAWMHEWMNESLKNWKS